MKNIILIVSTLLATSAIAQTDLLVTAIPSTDGTQWEYERSYTLYDASGAALIAVTDWVDNQVDTANVADGSYVLVLEDSFGDGWEGAVLNVSVDNTTLMVGGGFNSETLVQAIDITNGELSAGLLDTDACLDPTACNFLVSGDCTFPALGQNCQGQPVDGLLIDCDAEFGWEEFAAFESATVDSLGATLFVMANTGGNQTFLLSPDGTLLTANPGGSNEFTYYFDGEAYVSDCTICRIFPQGFEDAVGVYINPAGQDAIDDLEAIILDLVAQVDSLTNLEQDCTEEVALAAEQYYQYGYDAGYADGLEDCEGEPSGLVDIDGNTVIPVVGYYNELGQVIDPRRHNGLIIRRHADGTFSKYIKQLR